MAKLLGDFTCVLPGAIYPVTISAGEDCPIGMEDYARQQNLLGEKRLNAAESKTVRTAGADQSKASHLIEGKR